MNRDFLIIANQESFNEISKATAPLGLNSKHIFNEKEIMDTLKEPGPDLLIFDNDLYRSDNQKYLRILDLLSASKKGFIMVSSDTGFEAVRQARASGAIDYIVNPFNPREFRMRLEAFLHKKIRISCIGGGSGLFSVLTALRTLQDTLLTSIVSVSDDGGSSGALRTNCGVLPPGDLRRSLTALSTVPELMDQLIQHRFTKPSCFGGHNFGNLFITALFEIKGTTLEAVRSFGDIFNMQGIVLPITNTEITLCARFADGSLVKGESKIDLGEGRALGSHIIELWHEPESSCDINVYSSLINSDIIIIGPGDLYSSVITNLLVRGISDAVKASTAKKIYICNIMTELAETTGFNASDHIKEIIKYLGQDCLDYVMISDTKLSDAILNSYAHNNQFPVKAGDLDQFRKVSKAKMIVADMSSETEPTRHDSDKLKNTLYEIINSAQ